MNLLPYQKGNGHKQQKHSDFLGYESYENGAIFSDTPKTSGFGLNLNVSLTALLIVLSMTITTLCAIEPCRCYAFLIFNS